MQTREGTGARSSVRDRAVQLSKLSCVVPTVLPGSYWYRHRVVHLGKWIITRLTEYSRHNHPLPVTANFVHKSTLKCNYVQSYRMSVKAMIDR